MNQPVGYAVGNILEIIETIKVLKNEIMPEDVEHIIKELGSYMLLLAQKCSSLEEGKEMIMTNIRNGAAFNKFKELVASQGGDISYIDNPDKFEKAKYIEPILAKQ
jgi:pyrimidine-nucleoside phosphorylase